MEHKIIAIGDSLTFGFPFREERSWVGILRREYGINIINKGINGDYTSGMLYRFQDDVVKKRPSHVIITGGANDAFSFVPYGDIVYNYREMIDIALSNNIIPIIGITPPVDDEFVEKKLLKFRFSIKEYCFNKNLTMIDFYSKMVDPETGIMKGIYDFDGSHPSPEGYKAMAKEAFKVLEDLINKG